MYNNKLSVVSYNQEWRELVFMTISYGYVYFLGSQVQNIGQYIEKSVRFRSWHLTTGVIITLICNQYIYVIYQNDVGEVGAYPHIEACPHTLLFARPVTSG